MIRVGRVTHLFSLEKIKQTHTFILTILLILAKTLQTQSFSELLSTRMILLYEPRSFRSRRVLFKNVRNLALSGNVEIFSSRSMKVMTGPDADCQREIFADMVSRRLSLNMK